MVFVTSRKSWTLRLTVCAAVLALAAGRAEAGLIIVNGSFEEPLTTGSTAVTGWKVVGPQVAVVNTSYNTNSITFQAQDGNQWLDLSGLFANSTADGVLMVGVLGLPIARARRRRGPVGPWWGRMAFGFLRLNSPCPPSEQHRTRPRSTCRPEVELLENRALPSTGYLFVPSFDTDAVLRYNETTGAFVDVFVTHKSGGLNQPNSVIVGPDHNLYVTSGFFGGPGQLKAVLRYDGTTGAFIDNFAQSSIINSPRSILFGPDGNLYVADGIDPTEGWVDRFNGTTGAFMGTFVPPLSGGLQNAGGMVFGPDGNLYVASARNSNVLRYDGKTGAFLGEFVSSQSGGLDHALSLTFGPDGDLYVASGGYVFPTGKLGGNPAVLRFQGPSRPSPGAFVDTFVSPMSGGLNSAIDLLFGPDRNGDGQQDLYVGSDVPDGSFGAKPRSSVVLCYDGLTGKFIDTMVTADSGGLDNPGLMAFTQTDPTTLAFTTLKQAASHGASLGTRVVNATRGALSATTVDSAGYQQINLTGFQSGVGRFTDPNLNGWGMDHTPNGPFAVANTSTGTITFYNAYGRPLPTVISVPAAPGQPVFPIGSPTGLVYNPTSDFVISAHGKSAPATFIFDTLDGLICGWNPKVDPDAAIVMIDNSAEAPFAASYTSLTIGRNHNGETILYAADSGGGPGISNDRIDMFDGHFQSRGSFTDANVATQFPGNTVFQVENVDNKLYVTFAGFAPPFGGVVDIFDTDGHLLTPNHFAANAPGAGPLENPWGIVLAPPHFGVFGNDLLIGNVEGAGHINAFDSSTGQLLGQLKHPDGTPIAIIGLWDLVFGGGKPANGGTNDLYFNAGFTAADPAGNGLFGVLRAAGDGDDHSLPPGWAFAPGPNDQRAAQSTAIRSASEESGNRLESSQRPLHPSQLDPNALPKVPAFLAMNPRHKRVDGDEPYDLITEDAVFLGQ